MTIKNLYTESEQTDILADIADLHKDFDKRNVSNSGRRYFTVLAKKYSLAERLEREVEGYKNGEIKPEELTSDIELARFFGVRSRYSIQKFLKEAMDPTKRDIKARVCLETAGPKGWPHLRDSGKIPPLEGRVRDLATLAVKKKWGKI